jgi:hypothetical protein
MLCDVAWARAHGTATFILPNVGNPAIAQRSVTTDPHAETRVGGLPEQIATMMEPRPAGDVCGRCRIYPMGPDGPPSTAHCSVLNAGVAKADPSCAEFDPVGDDNPRC